MSSRAPTHEPVPVPVAEMLSRYRAQLAERGYDWGDELDGGVKTLLRFADRCDPERWNEAFRAWKMTGTVEDPVATVAAALTDPLPAGVAVVRGGTIEVADPLPFALADRPFTYEVLIIGGAAVPSRLVEAVVTTERPSLEIDGLSVAAVEAVATGRLCLVADAVSRWTVVDERGGAWFPDDALRKYDARSRPFFHGNDAVVDVPAGAVTITVARGCEFRPVSVSVDVNADEETGVELSPQRIYDARGRGWYGADLHVHMNYTGDLVWTPEEASLVQRGEGLHLMNLVAANYSTELVYDRELLECFAGRDLPLGSDEAVARIGVEFRNDMFGHFHVLNPSAPPMRYYTGHPRSDEPHDWPPNAVAAEEFRSLGATIGYTHAVMVPMDDDGSPANVLSERRARSYEAREVVADAALGLVDSLDLMVGDIDGVEHLYHRLLGCGLRLAATAGTDVMLSRTRGRLTSNPPGWCRVYARLGDQPLSVVAWQDALRAGRTFATNGPWLELDVAGCGPGDTLSSDGERRVPAVARVIGPGVERLQIVGPEGVMATLELDPDSEVAELTAEVVAAEPLWLVAIARGDEHPLAAAGRPQVYAHTSPVWVSVGGRSVARAPDAEWCLDWLDRFETLARSKANFASAGQLEDLVDVLERARAFYRSIAAGAS